MADSATTANDFENARMKARLQSIFSTFKWKKPDLLSFYEVTKLIKPSSQAYKGMQAIPVKKIIGSENRYHDFSSAFYPKNTSLRERWQSIDAARLDNITLPPISVYKIGEWYVENSEEDYAHRPTLVDQTIEAWERYRKLRVRSLEFRVLAETSYVEMKKAFACR